MDAFSNFEKIINSPVHLLWSHFHAFDKWVQKHESQVTVDDDMKKMWEAAKDEKEKTEALVAESERTLSELSYSMDTGMDELVRLADEYGRLSLSGSFSGPLEKEIRLLELHCHSLEEQGVSGDQLEKMRARLEDRKRRLDVFNKAKEKRITKEVLGAKIVWTSAPDIPRQCSPVSHGRFSDI